MRELRDSVRIYYSGKLERHGPTPLGVDWPNAISQHLRFVQLLKLCDFESAFSLNDFGCGYGALLEFLAMRHGGAAIDYRGIDISPAMVAAARKCWSDRHRREICGGFAVRPSSRLLARQRHLQRSARPSRRGVGKLCRTDPDRTCSQSSRIGFAVNFMRPHDTLPTEDGLYRTEPPRWIDFCERLGGNIELVGDYGLREFTLLIRRQP